jgi:hypothetical protein
MPQLDLLTFSTQFFWFLFFFLLIYFRLVNTFLPKIALITKLRKKIKEIEIKNIDNLKAHATQQKINFETKLKQNFFTSDSEYKKLMTTSENQTKKNLQQINQKELLQANQLYVQTLLNIFISNYITTKLKI